VIETNGSRTVDAQELEYHDQEKWSPFDGVDLRVYPVYTVLRGKLVYAEGKVTGETGDGEYLSVGAKVAA
jgi:allantoinase